MNLLLQPVAGGRRRAALAAPADRHPGARRHPPLRELHRGVRRRLLQHQGG
ncbi:hypothetical protein LV779_28880 [Streptomyces thinghirensis]|nr:hypothetical protein [Streptomyces thinghirensis]